MHYIFNNINLEKYTVENKYKNKIKLISHYDYRTTDDITVYLSHGAGEKAEHNYLPLNSDYYLCWCKAEYKWLTSKGKKAFLVGSVYNEMTTPEKREPSTLVYVPLHNFKEDIEERILKSKLPNDILASSLPNPYLTKSELDSININNVTSIVDDTNQELFPGHNIIYSNRNLIEHIYKCKKLYSIAQSCVIDSGGTFDYVGVNHGIEMKYRVNKPNNYDDLCDMPMKNNLKLIHDALDEIYGE